MNKSLFVLFFLFFRGIVFCQPGVYYHLCFRLLDSTTHEIQSADVTDNLDYRFVNLKNDVCEGKGFITDEYPKFYCLISSNDYCVFKSILQIVKNQTDTMRLFFRYKSHDVAKRDYYVNQIVFLKGNYIVKRPPDYNAWQETDRRRSQIKKINGSIPKYKRRIFYCQLFALRRKSEYAKDIISDNRK